MESLGEGSWSLMKRYRESLGECSQSLLELYVESLEEPAGADGVELKLELELS